MSALVSLESLDPQLPSLSRSYLKVHGGVVWCSVVGWDGAGLRPILVFSLSLSQAEQNCDSVRISCFLMSACDDPVPNIVCTTVVARLTGRSDDIIATSTLHVPAYSYLLLSAFRDLVLSNFSLWYH